MVGRRVADAAAVMGGTVFQGDPDRVFYGAALDSRKLVGGELFFALPGTSHDGHEFVARALAGGAAAAVVARAVAVPPEATLVKVASPLAGLHALTRDVRRQLPRRLVGITGSAGKTTTKEILASFLATRYRVAKSPGNLNNTLGFPLALLGIDADVDWMVAEMGMSEPGELGRLSRLGRPDVALFLNVRPAHLERFGTLEAIAEAKAELLEGLAPGGLVVANCDDPRVRAIGQRHQGRLVWFGRGADADVRLVELCSASAGPGCEMRIAVADEEVSLAVPLLGEHNAENVLAATATAHALGVSLAEIAIAAPRLAPLAGRGRVLEVGGVTVVDDAYNANPEATAAALRAARALPASRYWAVLGAMLELGGSSPLYHRQLGELAAELAFDGVLAVGEEAKPLAEGAAAAPVVDWVADAVAASRWIDSRVSDGDLVLVKGSRGIGLERVVAALTERRGSD